MSRGNGEVRLNAYRAGQRGSSHGCHFGFHIVFNLGNDGGA